MYPKLFDKGLLKKLTSKKINLFYAKGELNINATGKLNFSTPFGQAINSSLKIKPAIKNNKPQIEISHFQLGSFNNLPCSFIEKTLQKQIKKAQISRYLSFIKELKPVKNGLTVTLYRKKIYQELKKRKLNFFPL